MIRGVAETVLYADDLVAAARFYANVLGLAVVRQPDDLMAVVRVNPTSVVLLFNHRSSAVPSRNVPSHGTVGPGHVAFLVDKLEAWRERLRAAGVPIEREIDWPRGGRSIYVRDPANNSVELMDRDIWP